MTAKLDVRRETVAARDDHPLAVTLYVPSGREPERVVIVAAATAVKQSFYEPFARYLATSGCAVVTFDYRGIGASRTLPIAEVQATIRDWGQKDYPAIVDFAAARFPGKPLQIVGHSVGGQLVGVLDNASRVDAVCTVAAQHGYWRLYPWRQALTYGLLWYVVMPLVTWVYSYFPAKKFRLGEDLPRGVALEWARFARSPDYLVAPDGTPLRTGFDAFKGPVLAYSFHDDARAPEACVRKLHDLFGKDRVELRHVAPASLGARLIGHVGFFFAKFKDSLWSESLAWLRAH